MKKISGLYPENVYIYAKKERRHNIYYRTLLEAPSSVYLMYAKSGREARALAPGLLKAWAPESIEEAWKSGSLPPGSLLKAWPHGPLKA